MIGGDGSSGKWMMRRALGGELFRPSESSALLEHGAFLPFLFLRSAWSCVDAAGLAGQLGACFRPGRMSCSGGARTTMTLLGSKVTVEGVKNLPPPNEAVMYVPNHCSFLDIFSLSGYLPRRFKYAAPPCGTWPHCCLFSPGPLLGTLQRCYLRPLRISELASPNPSAMPITLATSGKMHALPR
jgi:hypothetical protein